MSDLNLPDAESGLDASELLWLLANRLGVIEFTREELDATPGDAMLVASLNEGRLQLRPHGGRRPDLLAEPLDR